MARIHSRYNENAIARKMITRCIFESNRLGIETTTIHGNVIIRQIYLYNCPL